MFRISNKLLKILIRSQVSNGVRKRPFSPSPFHVSVKNEQKQVFPFGKSLQVCQFMVTIEAPQCLMDGHQSFKKFPVKLREDFFCAMLPHEGLDELVPISRCLDGKFCALSDQPVVPLSEGCIICRAEYVGDGQEWVGGELECGADEGEQPHHAYQVAGGGGVLLELFGCAQGGVIVPVEQVYSLLHLQPDEGEEAPQSWEGLVVSADDLYLFLDVGEGYAQEGVQCREDEAELIEDGAEGFHQDFLFENVGLYQDFQLFHHELQ